MESSSLHMEDFTVHVLILPPITGEQASPPKSNHMVLDQGGLWRLIRAEKVKVLLPRILDFMQVVDAEPGQVTASANSMSVLSSALSQGIM